MGNLRAGAMADPEKERTRRNKIRARLQKRKALENKFIRDVCRKFKVSEADIRNGSGESAKIRDARDHLKMLVTLEISKEEQ